MIRHIAIVTLPNRHKYLSIFRGGASRRKSDQQLLTWNRFIKPMLSKRIGANALAGFIRWRPNISLQTAQRSGIHHALHILVLPRTPTTLRSCWQRALSSACPARAAGAAATTAGGGELRCASRQDRREQLAPSPRCCVTVINL